jgi:hypothetical protein
MIVSILVANSTLNLIKQTVDSYMSTTQPYIPNVLFIVTNKSGEAVTNYLNTTQAIIMNIDEEVSKAQAWNLAFEKVNSIVRPTLIGKIEAGVIFKSGWLDNLHKTYSALKPEVIIPIECEFVHKHQLNGVSFYKDKDTNSSTYYMNNRFLQIKNISMFDDDVATLSSIKDAGGLIIRLDKPGVI